MGIDKLTQKNEIETNNDNDDQSNSELLNGQVAPSLGTATTLQTPSNVHNGSPVETAARAEVEHELLAQEDADDYHTTDLLSATVPDCTIPGYDVPLAALLEALLFVADEPIDVSQLAKALNIDKESVHQGLQQLAHSYCTNQRGLRLQAYNGKYQLVTNPALAGLIETFLNLDPTTKLSAPALETLAIIAYRQPTTRAQVEAVRGVDSSAILRSLVHRGLIYESGRLEGVGRPILYSVTEHFMHHFGLIDLDELPALELAESDMLWATTTLAESHEQAKTEEPSN